MQTLPGKLSDVIPQHVIGVLGPEVSLQLGVRGLEVATT